MASSTVCARTARSLSVTGLPWHAFRTPLMTFSRLKGSITPDRLMTLRLAVSIVENRPPHCGHCLRRRMLRPSSLVRESMTRESGLRQNGQCIAPLSLEPRGDRLAVRGKRLGFREGEDPLGNRVQRVSVVPDDLLRAKERRRGQSRRVPRLAAGGKHVIAAGEVIAEADRRRVADEDGAGVHEALHLGVLEQHLEMLGRIGVAEGDGGVEVIHEDDGGLDAAQGLDGSRGVAGAGDAGLDLARDGFGELRGGLLVVLGLADEVDRHESRIRRSVGDDEDLRRSGLGVDADDSRDDTLGGGHEVVA